MIKSVLFKSQYIKSNFILGIGTIYRVLISLVKSKLSAITLGSSGLGYVGLGTNLQNAGLNWTSAGMPAPYINLLTRTIQINNTEEQNKIISTAFTLQLIFAICIVLPMILFSRQASELILNTSSLSPYVIPIALYIPFQSLSAGYLYGTYVSFGRLGRFTKAGLVAATIELSCFVFLIRSHGIMGYFWATAIGAFSFWAMLVYMIHDVVGIKALIRPYINKTYAVEILGSGFIFVITGLFSSLLTSFIRIMILNKIGAEKNGFYHVVTVISGMYSPLLTSGLWARLSPSIIKSGITEHTKQEIKDTFQQIAVLAAIIQVCLILGGEVVLRLIYSKDFTGVSDFMPLFLLGDLIYLSAQPGVAIMLGQRKYLYYSLSLSTYYGLNALGVRYLLPRIGIYSVGVAHIIASSILLVGVLIHTILQIRNAEKIFRILGVTAFCISLLASEVFLDYRNSHILIKVIPLFMLLAIFVSNLLENQKIKPTV